VVNLSPADILRLPVAQLLAYRTAALIKRDVPMKPIGESKIEKKVREILGDAAFSEWVT